VIDAQNLHDKILLINLDDNMISYGEPEDLLRATQMDLFQAVNIVYSERADAVVETLLDHVGLPQLKIDKSVTLAERGLPRGIRDPNTGDALENSDQRTQVKCGIAVPPAPPAQMFPASVLDRPQIHKIFLNWKSRGMQFVFFTLPYGAENPKDNNYTPALAERAAQVFGGIAVALDWRGLTSCDHIHLDAVSAAKATKQLADALAAENFPHNFATANHPIQ
jgi:hypothetical protein